MTTRSVMCGRSSVVRRKCPRWFVPNWRLVTVGRPLEVLRFDAGVVDEDGDRFVDAVCEVTHRLKPREVERQDAVRSQSAGEGHCHGLPLLLVPDSEDDA